MPTKRKTARSKKQSIGGTELLVLELQEIHSAESQLARVLPRLMKAVESETLRAKLEERLDQGERLLQEVDTALEEMEESPGRKKNVAAEGLINDAREHVQEIQAGPALDAVLIGAIQKTEHYCIAAWGTTKALAEALGEKSVVTAMERALEEGRAYDEELTQLAEKEVTPLLLTEEFEDEEEEEEARAETRSRSGKSNGGAERRAS